MNSSSSPSRPHIVVIDPAINIAETKCFNFLALQSPIPCTYHLPAMYGLQSLAAEDMRDAKGIIVLGSASSVNERAPWQSQLEGWLKPHLEHRIPTLGLCYGHQMLAHMFGGQVDYIFPDQRKHKGLREIKIHATPWSEATVGRLVVSHGEAVVKAPASMRVIGKSAEIETDGFAHIDLPIWSFQSHPEATLEFLSSHEIALTGGLHDLVFGHDLMQRFLRFAAKSVR